MPQTNVTPKPTMPPMKASGESTEDQLKLATKQGEAYAEAMKGMDKESGAHIARAVEHEVALVVEEAEGMWHMHNGELTWQEPEGENAHIEAAVRDAADGRFIPGLTVTVTVVDPLGKNLGSHEQPFLWHPWLYHYGRSWQVPGEGDYTVHVKIDPPTFMRHDHENGKRFTSPVEVEFTRHIKPGQKFATKKQ